ncbi:phosrestin-2-like isoform X2 [Choristoneura fumiferana]|uniref:phosrestin-2-like isoform X2 n=1 Tax=Choristoneura fumiferana TaxID=7141 RepID=UPI003D157A15
MAGDSSLNSQRVFKKSSPNNKLTLYLASRDLVVETNSIDRIQGVLHVDADYVENRKLYGQVTLTFRYGREDEEVMGLKFCNEAIMSLAQVWPLNCGHEKEPSTALQEALIKRLGAHAYPFQLELTPLAPPSVQLVPAKQYHGAPIGTSYDVRAFIAEKVDEKVSRRNMVRMGIRVLQGASRAASAVLPPPSPSHSSFSALAHYQLLRLRGKNKQQEEPAPEPPVPETSTGERPPPRVRAEKPFLLCDGKLHLESWLDKSAYHHGEPIVVSFSIVNHSNKTVQHIKALVVQHVDVCMFSNGKFKNVVAMAKDEGTPVPPGQRLEDSYTVTPSRGVTKNWIALEDSYSKTGACLASTVICNSNSPEDRNVFAIYVSYYVKVKLSISGIGGELSVKLPFSLSHACINEAPTDSVMEEASHRMILEGRENSDDEEGEKDGEATADENQETDLDEDPKPEAQAEARQCVAADVCVNIIENKLCERPRFEGPPQVRNINLDEDDLNLIMRYPGPDT